jgi:hypothetical protein
VIARALGCSLTLPLGNRLSRSRHALPL